MRTDPAGEVLLAHHALLLAIPAFVPALIIVGVVLAIAIRDRREHPDDDRPEAPEADDERRSDAA